MGNGINVDGQAPRITTSTAQAKGRLKNHSVIIGSNPAVSLKSIYPNKIPYQGFHTATKVERGTQGAIENGRSAVMALASPNGEIKVQQLLSSLKTVQVYCDRLVKLNKVKAEEMDKVMCSLLAVGIQELTNKELLFLYQKTLSKDFADLKQALLEEHYINPSNKDVMACLANLYNLEALACQETSNRMIIAMDIDPAELPGTLPTLTTSHQSSLSQDISVQQHEDVLDMTERSLSLIVQVNNRAFTHEKETKKGLEDLATRGSFNVGECRQVGDILRSIPLTINVSDEFFLSSSGPLASLGEPWKNLFHLLEDAGTDDDKRQAVFDIKGESYFARREAIEGVLFPQLSGRKATATKERPTYAALNVQRTQYGAEMAYGAVSLHLKPEVAKRASYMISDSFHDSKITITAEAKERFFKLLPDIEKLSPETQEALRDKDSKVYKQVKKIIDSIPLDTVRSASDFGPIEGTYSLAVDDEKIALSENDSRRIIALAIRTFANKEANERAVVDHDHLEQLVPNLDFSDALALMFVSANPTSGTIKLPNCTYIEAQVHGELSLLNDVEEIVFDPRMMNIDTNRNPFFRLVVDVLNGIPIDASRLTPLSIEQQDFIAQIQTSLNGKTIKCTIANNNQEDNSLIGIRQRVSEFSAGHYDKDAISRLARGFSSSEHLSSFFEMYQHCAFFKEPYLPKGMLDDIEKKLKEVATEFAQTDFSKTATTESAIKYIADTTMKSLFSENAMQLFEQLFKRPSITISNSLLSNLIKTQAKSIDTLLCQDTLINSIQTILQDAQKKEMSPDELSINIFKAVETFSLSYDALPEKNKNEELSKRELLDDAIRLFLANPAMDKEYLIDLYNSEDHLFPISEEGDEQILSPFIERAFELLSQAQTATIETIPETIPQTRDEGKLE